MTAPWIPSRSTDLLDMPSALSGNPLQYPRVNDAGDAYEFSPGADAINVEEARSDIRSTTRAGYSTFDSQPGLQALLDIVGMYKTLYIPDNGTFNLNGKILTTKSKAQAIIGGVNACLVNGQINLYHRFCTLKNLYLHGDNTLHGINVDLNQSFDGVTVVDTQPTLGPQMPLRFMSDGVATDPYFFRTTDPYYAHISVQNVRIAGKNIGLNIPRHLGWSRFLNVAIDKCSTYGSYIDMSSQSGDWGDMVFTNCDFTHSPIGMGVVKSGGLRLINCKMHLNTVAGLKLSSPVVGYSGLHGSVGTYITGSCFEDNGPSGAQKDVWLTSEAGVSAVYYPRYTQIVGGTIHHLYLDKCLDTTVTGTLLTYGLTINSGAAKTLIYGELKNGYSITGTGTDYMVLGFSASGPTIRVGGRLTLIDSLNPAGKYL